MKGGRVRRSGVGARWRWVVAVLIVVASTLLLEGVAAAEYSEQQLLTQSDGYKNDNFGESVALSDDGNTAIDCHAIPPGFSMFTAYDRNSPESPRVRLHLPRFESAPVPDPEQANWHIWQKLLASQENDNKNETSDSAMCVVTRLGFGTVNASVLALPAPSSPPRRPVWRFAPGPPCINSFSVIKI